MTETADPPRRPPARRRVAVRRGRSRALDLAAQAVLIVFGVVVGLALNEWREDRAEAARTDRVLAALADEVAGNRAAVQSVTPYYGAMVQGAQRLMERRDPDATFDPREIEGYTGDMIPTLKAGTYDAAAATGALLGVDIGLASALSSVYASQRAFEVNRADNRLTRMSRPTPQVTSWRAGAIYTAGRSLTEQYDDVLGRLRTRAE